MTMPITDTTYTRPLQCDSCDWQGDESQEIYSERCPKCGRFGLFEPLIEGLNYHTDDRGIIQDIPALAAGMAVMAILCTVAYKIGVWSMGGF